MADELWRTMQEPEIDSRLAEGLRSNRSFAEWWFEFLTRRCQLFDDFSADAARRVWARMSGLIIEE